MKRIILFVLVVSMISCSEKAEVASLEIASIVKSSMEYAYFEGQKDAYEGDVRITKTGLNYIWIESPWDDGTMPSWNPGDEIGVNR